MQNVFSKIIKYVKNNSIPLLLFLYILGLVYNISYYRFWSIDILQYMDLSESVLFPIRFIYSILGGTILLLIVLGTIIFILDKETNLYENEHSGVVSFMNKHFPSIKSRLGKEVIFNSLFIFSGMVIMINILRMSIKATNIIFSLSCMILFVVFLYFLLADRKIASNLLRKKIYYIILIFIMLSFFKGFEDYHNAKSFNRSEKISFFANGVNYSESESIRYIGQTSNYMFLYSVPQEEVLVFRTDKIDNMKISKIK